MKKMSYMGLVALLVLSLASIAQAADIKAFGKWQIDAQWNNSQDFETLSQNKSFHIEQRIRTGFQFIANENLKAVLDTQIGSNSWGNGAFAVGSGRSPSAAAGGGAGAAGVGNIMLRQGYLDFKWPGTKVNFKVGFQSLKLPAAFGGGSAILDDQIAAAVVAAPIVDGVTLVAGYARPTDANASGSTGINVSGTASDVVFAALPIDVKGFNIAPFAAYAYGGANSGLLATPGMYSSRSSTADGVRGYWAGAAFTMTYFQPFKVMADLNYGKATNPNYLNSDKSGGRSGWLFDLAVDYTGLSMMTPQAFFVYTSGESGRNTETSGRMPVLGNPQTWAIGSFFFGDRNMISGYPTNATGGNTGGYVMRSMGFWALGLSLNDIKLVKDFTHTFTVLYAKGTNDDDYWAGTRTNVNYGAMLSDKDHIWEVDFNTKYKIYDELSMFLDLGYVNASYDKDTWRRVNANYGGDSATSDNAYKVALGLVYSF